MAQIAEQADRWGAYQGAKLIGDDSDLLPMISKTGGIANRSSSRLGSMMRPSSCQPSVCLPSALTPRLLDSTDPLRMEILGQSEGLGRRQRNAAIVPNFTRISEERTLARLNHSRLP